MKKIKSILFLVFAAFITLKGMAQLKAGDFVYTLFLSDKNLYVAEVISINETGFKCRYLHTQSQYVFTDFRKENSLTGDFTAVVESNVGGKYKKGSKVTLLIYRPDYSAKVGQDNFNAYWERSKNSDDVAPIIVRFSDGKKYLASVNKKISDNDAVAEVTFWHTNSVYQINVAEGKVVKSGGGYKKDTELEFFECSVIN